LTCEAFAFVRHWFVSRRCFFFRNTNKRSFVIQITLRMLSFLAFVAIGVRTVVIFWVFTKCSVQLVWPSTWTYISHPECCHYVPPRLRDKPEILQALVRILE
jgi:hypothetical protein